MSSNAAFTLHPAHIARRTFVMLPLAARQPADLGLGR